MVRYNAAHPGAEREVFPHLGDNPPGVVSYVTTRWGTLPKSKHTPKGEQTPTGTDCYRFAMSNPHVDICLSGPANAEQLDLTLAALDRGPMTEHELAWMRRVGSHVRVAARSAWRGVGMAVMDRVMGGKAET
ncbi:MAG: hypothetical protein V3T05_03355 [Myxococcota bacterium]